MTVKRMCCALLAAVLLLLAGCAQTDGESSEESVPETIIEVEELDGESSETAPELPKPGMTVEEARLLLTPVQEGYIPITTSDHLVALSVVVNEGQEDYAERTYVLQNDLSLTLMAFPSIGGGTDPDTMPAFNGVFEGRNHVISVLTITEANAFGTGLFGAVGPEGEIRNLHVTGGSVNGFEAAGGIAGFCAGTLTNCSYRGAVVSNGRSVGGLCGLLDSSGSVSQCFSNAEVSGNEQVGGFIGTVREEAAITDCYALGTVNAIDSPLSENAPSRIGGFIGSREAGALARCFSSTEVYTRVASRVVGGFIGYNDGDISSCYFNHTATENWEAIDANVDDREVDLMPCSVAELLEQSTFSDWDFSSVWGVHDARNRGMPHLRAAWLEMDEPTDRLADEVQTQPEPVLSFQTEQDAEQSTVPEEEGDL